MASRLSSQHASHSSTPAHTFTGMSAAPTATVLPKVQPQEQQQEPAQQNGIQMMQVSCCLSQDKSTTRDMKLHMGLKLLCFGCVCVHSPCCKLCNIPAAWQTGCFLHHAGIRVFFPTNRQS